MYLPALNLLSLWAFHTLSKGKIHRMPFRHGGDGCCWPKLGWTAQPSCWNTEGGRNPQLSPELPPHGWARWGKGRARLSGVLSLE